MDRILRLLALACAVAWATFAAVPFAAAQPFPDKPVRILVGFAPGGVSDFVARMLAQQLSQIWGQSVVVENRTGASGTIAGAEVVRAKPDGYTLLVSPQTAIAVAPQMMPKPPYDPLRDLTPITVIASSPLVLVAHPSFAPDDFAQFIAHVRANPGKINFGSGGMGSSPHMTQELLNKELDLKMIHVPYRGEAPALNDVLGGQVPVLFANIPTGMPHVNSGQLKALVTTGRQRSPQAKDIPTIKESGVAAIETATWNALYAPAGMDPKLVQKIYKDVVQAMSQGDTRERLLASGNEPVLDEPAAFARFLQSEVSRWGEVVRAGNLQIN
jgi:tripartite-type tricarboxylate transporter receptor subunit TctC